MIIKLHENLINKIAAGEVVERPASVVKELIENSIDADADKITLNIEKAGIKLIEVIDNGRGMSKEDAKIATNSHTTSKISTMQDLETVYTMGFRGEALASIASVSDFTLVTKNADSKSATKIKLKGGKEKEIEKTSGNNGTKISVKNLFYNVPARRKFLKTERTEYKHILRIFQNYAIAFPHIHFILTHNKKGVYNLPSSESDNFNDEVKVRINDIYKKEISQNLIPVKYNSPSLNIRGFLGHPKISSSRSAKQSIFLNKRPVSDKLISKAIYDSYHTLIPKGEYPIFFIFLKINPELVDVNVHPRKSEVRFSNSQEIFKAIKNSTRQTLLKFLQNDVRNAVNTFEKGNKRNSAKNRLKNYKKSNYSNNKPSKRDISQSVTFTKSLLKESKNADKALSQNQEAKQKNLGFDSSFKSFQVLNEVIIVEKNNTLLFIDQHAAAERITFEKLKAQINRKKIERQKLLIPEVLDLDKSDYEILLEHKKLIEKLGIAFEKFGKSSVKIIEIPALLQKSNSTKLLSDMIKELDDISVKEESIKLKEIADDTIATMACHSSIRGGMKLSYEQIKHLVKDLLSCESPYSCPHGRPIIWELTKDELEKEFGRP